MFFGRVVVQVFLIPRIFVDVIIVAPFKEVVAKVVTAEVVGTIFEIDGLNDG